jgi:hypothetical protein
MAHNESELSKWMALSELAAFLNYKPTQLANLLKNKTLIISKIGKRKFVLIESVSRLLEEHIN